jgi:pentapeptide MXKDX repeat protein
LSCCRHPLRILHKPFVTLSRVAHLISDPQVKPADIDKEFFLGENMKKTFGSWMLMCVLTASMAAFAQDQMKQDDIKKNDAQHDTMKNDQMKNDKKAKKASKKDHMGKDSMKQDNMKHDDMKKDDAKKDDMKQN